MKTNSRYLSGLLTFLLCVSVANAVSAASPFRGTGHAAPVGHPSNQPAATYMIDDGTAEDSVGLTNGGQLTAVNMFQTIAGSNVINQILIAWGTPAFPDPTLNGLPYTASLYSDPNGDGNPADAVLLASAAGVISMSDTNTFLTTNIAPTLVTTARFFVGFTISHVAGQFPAAFDETAPTFPNTSWVNVGPTISGGGAIPIEQAGLVGNWLIRANAIPEPSTWAMLGFGGSMLGAFLRFRRRS